MIAPEIEGYIRRSNEFWRQAKELLDQNHLEKASELAWGSVVERIKALALARSASYLRSHRQLRDYVRLVAHQNNDPALYEAFRQAERLHINFYESYFDITDVREAFLGVEDTLRRVDAYLTSP